MWYIISQVGEGSNNFLFFIFVGQFVIQEASRIFLKITTMLLLVFLVKSFLFANVLLRLVLELVLEAVSVLWQDDQVICAQEMVDQSTLYCRILFWFLAQVGWYVVYANIEQNWAEGATLYHSKVAESKTNSMVSQFYGVPT